MSFQGRSKPRKKTRPIVEHAENDDDDDFNLQLQRASAARATAAKQRPATKVSFGDDDEDAVVVKKKKKKPKARGMSLHNLDGSASEASSRGYSETALADLKLSTPQMPYSYAKPSPAEQDVGM